MATAALGNIEIGIGGDLAGLRGRYEDGSTGDHLKQYRVFEGNFRAQLEHLKALLADYDPEARVQFLETPPPQRRAEEFGEVAASCSVPVKQFTALYVIGGNDTQPDALDTLRSNLELAGRAGTVERLNMQVWGNNASPPMDTLIDFYVRAEDMAQTVGIELYTETHVDRFTYDPRRLVAVHEALLDHTGGRLGLRVTADLSHYVHQSGNSHFANWPATSSGELNLNPLDPNNYVSRNIIPTSMVGYGHLRSAVPNDLPRDHGSIQYPIVNPRTDPATADVPNGGMREPWEGERLEPWLSWYREIFAYQLRHSGRPVARFATEFIGSVGPNHYRVEPYRNLFQNIAMVATAQRMIRALRRDLSEQRAQADS